MKKIPFFFLVLIISLANIKAGAQAIVNVVLVGDKGVTEDVKEATSFIVIKQYPGNIFERLDYKMSAPLIKLRTYNDSLLTQLQGAYIEYYTNGFIHVKGQYENNMKAGEWYYYSTDDKHQLTETYDNGALIKKEIPDTTKKVKDSLLYGDEREANFKGNNNKAWVTYLQKNLKSDVAQQSLAGGKVRVLFVINKEGVAENIYMKKSVEFVLDEEAIRVIRASPKWVPAFQNGKTVNAYRIQPLTFQKN